MLLYVTFYYKNFCAMRYYKIIIFRAYNIGKMGYFEKKIFGTI